MAAESVRVVLGNQPYLVVCADDGSIDRAYGPFTPGTEPSLVQCTPDIQVVMPALLADLRRLLPVSPRLPASEDTLAGS